MIAYSWWLTSGTFLLYFIGAERLIFRQRLVALAARRWARADDRAVLFAAFGGARLVVLGRSEAQLAKRAGSQSLTWMIASDLAGFALSPVSFPAQQWQLGALKMKPAVVSRFHPWRSVPCAASLQQSSLLNLQSLLRHWPCSFAREPGTAAEAWCF